MSANRSSSRRSPRSHSGRRPQSASKKQSRAPYAAKPVKANVWSKILRFFGLGKNNDSYKKKNTSSKTERNSSSKERTPRPSRKPEHVEVTTPRLYIGNLSFDATESDLFELFSGVGQVQNVELVSHKDTHRSKGFGFVQMTSTEEAKRAVSELHDKEYMGRKLVVSGAKAFPESRSEKRSEPAAEAATAEEACGGCCDHHHSENAE